MRAPIDAPHNYQAAPSPTKAQSPTKAPSPTKAQSPTKPHTNAKQQLWRSYIISGTAGGEHKGEVSPAIITKEYEEGRTCEFFEMNADGVYLSKVAYSEEAKPGHWSWPPRE